MGSSLRRVTVTGTPAGTRTALGSKWEKWNVIVTWSDAAAVGAQPPTSIASSSAPTQRRLVTATTLGPGGPAPIRARLLPRIALVTTRDAHPSLQRRRAPYLHFPLLPRVRQVP